MGTTCEKLRHRKIQTSTLSGISSGRFDVLSVRNPQTGQFEEILPGELASQQDLLQVYVGGVLYSSVRALNFTDPQFYLDNASGIMNIGQQLHQSFLRLGSSSAYTELTRGYQRCRGRVALGWQCSCVRGVGESSTERLANQSQCYCSLCSDEFPRQIGDRNRINIRCCDSTITG